MPQRSCVVCRETRGKRDLVRLVRGPDGAMHVDERGRAPGRGAYLCPEAVCWQRALRTDALGRALRGPLSAADRARVEQYVQELETATGAGQTGATATADGGTA